MPQLDRAVSYLSLQLIGAGFYCLEPSHLDQTVLIAGRDGQGFVLLFEEANALDGAQPESAAMSKPPAELSFLALPLRRVRVAPAGADQPPRIKLVVALDADLLAQLPHAKQGEFGILLQPA